VTETAQSEVLCEVSDEVALVTFNRPDHFNSWTASMEAEYFDRLDRLDADPGVRVIVVRGVGDRSFCSGADVNDMSKTAKSAGVVNPLRTRPMTYARSIRKPMIAAINGACAGIGLVQALCCDIRFAVEGVTMTTAFTRRGLAAEFGTPWLLVRTIGTARASDLLLSGRRFTSGEAAQMGMINAIFPRDELMPFVLDYAREMAANCAPLAMATIKEQLRRDWERPLSFAEGEALLITRDPQRREDLREGIASFLERRPPHFAPLPPRINDF
jgi:enoyl-CoA hydratase/carnithine racemase